jgi:hypothetical protein
MIIVWKKWTITFFVFIDLKFGFYKIALWLNTLLLDIESPLGFIGFIGGNLITVFCYRIKTKDTTI